MTRLQNSGPVGFSRPLAVVRRSAGSSRLARPCTVSPVTLPLTVHGARVTLAVPASRLALPLSVAVTK